MNLVGLLAYVSPFVILYVISIKHAWRIDRLESRVNALWSDNILRNKQ